MGVRINPQRRTLKNVYRTYVDVITYIKTDKRRYNNSGDGLEEKGEGNAEMKEEDAGHNQRPGGEAALNEDHTFFTEQEIEEFKAFSKKPDVYELLIDSLAPSIWENHDVKKGILCQLFGGVSKEF